MIFRLVIFFLSWILLLVSLVPLCYGYSQGSAIVNAFESSYCESGLDDMQRGPLHYDMVSCGGVCRANIAPLNMYALRTNSSEYSVNNVTVHLRANSRMGATILGFVILAIAESGRTAGNWVADESDDPEVLRATCDSTLEGQVIFHARSSSTRTSVEVVWDPKRTNYGRIIFRAWVVQRHDVIFTVDSRPLINPLDGADFIPIESQFLTIIRSLLGDINTTKTSTPNLLLNPPLPQPTPQLTRRRNRIENKMNSTPTTTTSPQPPSTPSSNTPQTTPSTPSGNRLQRTRQNNRNRRPGGIFKSVRNRIFPSQNRLANNMPSTTGNNDRNSPDTRIKLARQRSNNSMHSNKSQGKDSTSLENQNSKSRSMSLSSSSAAPPPPPKSSSLSPSSSSSLQPSSSPPLPSPPSSEISESSSLPSVSTQSTLSPSRDNIHSRMDSVSTESDYSRGTAATNDTSQLSSPLHIPLMQQFEDSFLSRMASGFNLTLEDPFSDFNKDTYSLFDFFPSNTLPDIPRMVAQVDSNTWNAPRRTPSPTQPESGPRRPFIRRRITNESTRPTNAPVFQTLTNSLEGGISPNRQRNNQFQTDFQRQMQWPNQNMNNLPWMTPMNNMLNFQTSPTFQDFASPSQQRWPLNGNQQSVSAPNMQRLSNPGTFSSNRFGQFPNANQMLGRSLPGNNFQMTNNNNQFVRNRPSGFQNRLRNNGNGNTNSNMALQNQIRMYLASRNNMATEGNSNSLSSRPSMSSQRQPFLGMSARGRNQDNRNRMSFNWFG